MEEKKKKKDWTKVDVKDIRKYLPKILLFFVLFLPLLYIMGLSLANMQNNTPNANSGITVENKIYKSNTSNITEIPKNLSKSDNTDISPITDLVKSTISWFPIIFGLFLLFKVFSWVRD